MRMPSAVLRKNSCVGVIPAGRPLDTEPVEEEPPVLMTGAAAPLTRASAVACAAAAAAAARLTLATEVPEEPPLSPRA
jgi:hypothetical protein